MPYIGAGIQRFNTADSLTVNGDAEVTGTVNPSGDTASGDTAAVGFTSAEGLILTGQGSTSDITFKNDADTTVFTIPTGTDDISFPDNAAILMGAGNDLKIFHNGSNSQINDLSTGNLQLLSNGAGVDVLKTDGAVMAKFITDGAVELYHNNTKRIETTSVGVGVDQLFGLSDTDTGIALGANGANITQFYTANNERLRIAADGKVGVNTTAANLQMSVNFDSSADAGLGIHDTNSGNLGGMLQFYSGSGQGTLRGNIQNANNAGIHVNVGTGSVVFTQTGYTAANALDDYEEGTFTPEIRIGGSTSGITQSSQVGQYTKIGRMVTLTGRVAISDKGSNTGAMTIAGMPFASQNTTNLESIGAVELNNMSSGTDNLSSLTNNNVICRISPNVLTIEMRRTMIGANDITNVQMSDSTVVSFTITYFT